jgi:hypothetical protein
MPSASGTGRSVTRPRGNGRVPFATGDVPLYVTGDDADMRGPFTASFEYRRRLVSDRWWLLAGVLIVAGGVLLSVTAAGWLLIVLGTAALIVGIRRRQTRA